MSVLLRPRCLMVACRSPVVRPPVVRAPVVMVAPVVMAAPGGPGRGPHPEPAEVVACRDALAACLAANPADATCVQTERTCVRDAFRAAFDAACADATTLCTTLPAEACAHLTARCAEGIDGRVELDGGVCSAPPAVP